MNIEENKSLARYSTFMVGGMADYLAIVESQDDIKEAIRFAKGKQIPHIFIGGGSNIIFDDLGFRGLVIINQSQNYQVVGDQIMAESGMRISKLVNIALENSLNGLEPWIGLPGTVGGAIRGNAGCHGLETKDILVSALILDPETLETSEVSVSEMEYAYRESKIKHSDLIVLAGTVKLDKERYTKEETQALIREYMQRRITKQPRGLTCGSFFKNPEGDSSGRLIESAGLKGYVYNSKVQISDKHANFFLNLGGATANDIKELARMAREKVRSNSGIVLQEEVQIYDQFGKTVL